MKEEFGIEITIERFLFNLELITDNAGHWFGPVYLCKIKKGIPQIMEPEYCTDIGWFYPDNLPNNIAEPDKLILKRTLKILKQGSLPNYNNQKSVCYINP